MYIVVGLYSYNKGLYTIQIRVDWGKGVGPLVTRVGTGSKRNEPYQVYGTRDVCKENRDVWMFLHGKIMNIDIFEKPTAKIYADTIDFHGHIPIIHQHFFCGFV